MSANSHHAFYQGGPWSRSQPKFAPKEPVHPPEEWQNGFSGEGQSFAYSLDQNRAPKAEYGADAEPEDTKGLAGRSCGKLSLASTQPQKLVVILLAAAALAGLGFLLVEVLRVPDYSCPKGSGRVSVESRKISINPSATGEVCVLRSTADAFIGRSYDGSAWEQSTTAQVAFTCHSGNACTVTLPSTGTFYLETFKGEKVSAVIAAERSISRFLMQGTFGPTRADIAAFGSKRFKTWVREQIAMTPSIHREYFRKRASPKTVLAGYAGKPKGACEHSSRWHRYTFTEKDIGKTIVVSPPAAGRVTLSVDATVRTSINAGQAPPNNLKICSVIEGINGEMRLGVNCVNPRAGRRFRNPEISINFGGLPAARRVALSGGASLISMEGDVNGVKVLRVPGRGKLAGCNPNRLGPVYMNAGGPVYAFDSRLVMLENTVDEPAEGYDLNYCISAAKTFLNSKGCKVGGKGCTPRLYSSANVALNVANLRAFYEKGGFHVYRIQGLRLDNIGNPCATKTSRWLRLGPAPCASGETNGLHGPTKTRVVNLLAAGGSTVLVKEIRISGGTCNPVSLKGARVHVSGACYKHVHPDEFNVYDFSQWALPGTDAHPGTIPRLRKQETNPITDPGDKGQIAIVYPNGHSMGDWAAALRKDADYQRPGLRDVIKFVGIFGRGVDFKNLPPSIQSAETAAHFGASALPNPADAFEERCGSPGEVANDPSLGNRYFIGQYHQDEVQFPTESAIDYKMYHAHIKTSVWTMLALNAPDQLRQRMAFALSQIPVVTIAQVPGFEDEIYITYYDIFVRNAFGNYRDILLEVSYSPMMAAMLTYEATKSIDYSFQKTQQEIYPDENYAREIMQLFSVGLLRLNSDGTVQKAKSGFPLETYTNDDIFTFARVWTGFRPRTYRGNFEALGSVRPRNRIDPMEIVAEWRDMFPKMNLYKGHLGDGLPLCIDIPPRMFLLKGAKWRYVGTSPSSKLQYDPRVLENPGRPRIVLGITSRLYQALCSPQAGKCSYKSEVVLSENLECHNRECDVTTVRTVKVGGAYYEYVPPACANLPFFNNGVKIWKYTKKDSVCADPREVIASPLCCTPEGTFGHNSCVYHGERVDRETARARCSLSGRRVCEANNFAQDCNPEGYFWTSSPCKVQLRVRQDAQVSIVHDLTGSRESINKMLKSVADNNVNFFRVDWKGGVGNAPTVENHCLNGLCRVHQGEFCLCEMQVEEASVFTAMPANQQVTEELHIGSLEPGLYGRDYNLVESVEGVDLYALSPADKFASTSIFKTTLHGKDVYFRNMRSVVHISDSVGFRNTPTIMRFSEPSDRDAQYETEAFIDHLIYHPNTAPFIAYRIIQRFVSSNPSPRYVGVVAKAFAEGSYEGIGSGNYGDLAATIAATLLDDEARNMALDFDPAFGQLREPVIKWVHLMRSLEAILPRGRQIEPNSLEFTLAEEPHRAPNVFNYFRPEFSPPGPVARARMVAPEAMIFTSPRVVSYLNAMVSTVKFGVSNCFDGFVRNNDRPDCDGLRFDRVPKQAKAHARLAWTPSSPAASKEDIVDELDILLTAGRLEQSTREVLLEAYDHAFRLSKDGVRRVNAIMAVQQLLIGSPEFQVTNRVQRFEGTRRPTAPKRNGTAPFKAVVVMFLNGGMDAYNLIVPHSNCKNGKDMYEEYTRVRTDIKLPKNALHEITVPAGKQVCETFGIHPQLPVVQQLYNDGEALFLANVGVLVEPVTKQELLNGEKEIPESLFAHNIQQQSTQTLTPQDRNTVGVLGRANDILWKEGYSTGSFSLSTGNYVLEPQGQVSPPQVFLDRNGAQEFNPSQIRNDKIDETMFKLSENIAHSVYAETWSDLFEKAFNESKQLSEELKEVTLDGPYQRNTNLAKEFENVAKLIKARGELGMDRQSFFVEVFGFDTHSDNGDVLNVKFKEINDALENFVSELKLQGVWDDVVIIEASDFARTITSNGAGTDHGWGGHYMMFGGGIKGGTMLGEFPDDLTAKGDLNIGRGRFIPSYSWEAVWNAVIQWYGVPKSKLGGVMPYLQNFGPQDLFDPTSLFKNVKLPKENNGDNFLTALITLGVASVVLVSMMGAMGYLVYKRRGEIKSTARKISTIIEGPHRVESSKHGDGWSEQAVGPRTYKSRNEFNQ